MKIFSIKNEKLGFFNRPIYCESEAEALSYIQNVLMSDADRALSSLKDDLSLYDLGYIDFTNGIIKPSTNILDPITNELCIEPILVCSLRDIFDTIPEDKLKPSLTREDIEKCYELFKTLSQSVEDRFNLIDDKILSLDKCKKGVKLYS